MTTLDEVRARVGSVFGDLDLPSWPDPHPGMASPRDDEYSRVTDARRYRVVHARARAWAAVLDDVVGARAERLTPAPVRGGETRAFDRGVRLVPRRSGALPLLLLERDVPTVVGDATLAVLEIAVARADVVVETQPDCGCDACDSGSGDLLAAIDSAIGAVVEGPFVVLQAPTWRARWHPGGGQASSEGRGPDFPELMELCRRLADGQPVRLPAGAEAFVGRSWLG